MEEKKLTDDELLRLLEIFAKDDEPNGVRLLAEGALDFIHRLQSEKKELKSIAEYQQGSNMERWRIIQEKDKTIAEQKAEIERLTEERDVYLDDCSAIRHKLRQEIEEKFELQKQVDELQDRLASVLVGIKADELLVAKGVEQAVKDTAKEIFEKIFEVLCCFTTQGKSKEYNEGCIDCLAEVDKRLQNLAKEEYGVEVE